MDRFDRQIRVFGQAGQRALGKLVVGIVGLGGIGSLVFILLVRLGVLRMVAVDPDTVEETNLNRLAGSTIADAENRTPKVDMSLDCRTPRPVATEFNEEKDPWKR